MSCASHVNVINTQFFDDRISECFLAIDSASRPNIATWQPHTTMFGFP